MSRFILIRYEAHTLPYAIDMDADSLDAAVASVPMDGILPQNQFLIDLEERKISRILKVGEAGQQRYEVHDSAYQVVGGATPDEFFIDPEGFSEKYQAELARMEAEQCD